MSNQLVVKEVDFQGSTLLGVQTEDGKIHAGVKWICEGIGLSDGQMKRQKQNLSEDMVLQKGVTNLRFPSNGGLQETLVIDIEFLPLWLAKISITPTMQREQPELTNKLIEYQLKAKDVLAKEFIHNPIQEYLAWDEDERAIAFFQKSKENKILLLEKTHLEEEKKINTPKVQFYETYQRADEGDLEMEQAAKSLGVGVHTFYKFLRWGKAFYKDQKKNLPQEKYVKQGYFVTVPYTYSVQKKDGTPIERNDTKVFVTPKGLERLGIFYNTHFTQFKEATAKSKF